MLIHISGTSGSGKTTLGRELKQLLKSKVIVKDTDEFIQHGTKNAKKLQNIKKCNSQKIYECEYKNQFNEIIKTEIDNIIKKYPNKTIILTGLLNNWSINNEPYKIHIDCKKIFLEVSLPIIIKRYYLRIYETEKNVSKKRSEWYWNCISKGECYIKGSKDIIKSYEYDLKWHIKNGYQIMKKEDILKYFKIKD